MTTIGYATLQIIPSLKGVSDAIEKQIAGKTIEVKIAPKVDKAATTKAGKEAGETIAKEATDAVSKGEIGKAVTDGIRVSVKKSSAGKEIGKVIVDGLTDGVKQGLPSSGARGGIGEQIVKGVTDDAKAAAKNNQIGSSLGTVLTEGLIDGIKEGLASSGAGKAITDGLNTISGNVKTAMKPILDVASSATIGIQGLQTAIDAAKNHDLQGTVTAIVTPLKELEKIGLPEGFTKTLQDAAANSKAVGDNVRGVTDPIRDAGKGTKAEKWTDAAGVIGDIVQSLVFLKDAFSSFGTWLNSQDWARFIDPKTWAQNLKGAWGVNPNFGTPGTPGVPAVVAAPPAPGQAPLVVAPPTKPPAPTADPNLFPFLIPKKATGGQIHGPGTGISDSILARVSNEEFIVNADATRKNLPLLEIINSGKLPGFAGGGLVAGDQQLRQIIMERFGISDIGGYRPADKYGEHSTGRALDVMVGNNKSKGDAVKDFALANASAIDLKWAIWRQHLYLPGGGGHDMPDRGSPTQNHMDHVHIFSGTGITNGLRGALAGGPGAAPTTAGAGAPSAAKVGGPGAEDMTASDQTASPGSSPGGGFSLPSSISGLSGLGLSGLGKGVGTTGSGSDLSLFGNAAASAVTGQASSFLGAFGISDNPPILQAASQLLSGISIGGHGGSSATPVSASSTATGTPPPDGVQHGTHAGQAPGPVFNTTIQARDAEGALEQWKRWQDQRVAAKTAQL